MLGAALAVCLGTAAQLLQPALWTPRAYLILIGVSVVLVVCVLGGCRRGGWLHRTPDADTPWGSRRAGVVFVVAAVALASLCFGATGWRAVQHQSTMWPRTLEGQSVRLECVVVGLPQVTDRGLRFACRMLHIAAVDGAWHRPAQGLVNLAWYGAASPPWARTSGASHPPSAGSPPFADTPDEGEASDDDRPEEAAGDVLAFTGSGSSPLGVRSGERWRFTVRLKAPRGLVNPHGFDQALWLWERGFTATGHVRQHPVEPAPVRLQAGPEWGWDAWRAHARGAIERAVPDAAGAARVAALLVGDQSGMARADWDVFRATGVTHLMAISGLHITGLAWLAAGVLGAVWRRWPWPVRGRWPAQWCATPSMARWAGACVAVLYAVFSGWGVPAQRTVGMLLVSTLLTSRGLRWPWPLVTLTVAAVVVAWDPWAMAQAGFWLSFVAVSLLMVAGAPSPRLEGASEARVGSRGWHAFRRLVREQAIMTVCLAPLSLALFQQVSLVGMLANVVAVPVVTLWVTPLCLLGLVWAPLWSLAAGSLEALMRCLHGLAAWPDGVWSVAAAPAWVSALALAGGAMLAMPWPLWWRATGGLWMVPLLAWQPARPAPGDVALLAVDIGQGQAVLVQTAHHSLLYDTGPRYSPASDAGQRVLVPLLRALAVRLDAVVVSHQDSDHSGGWGSVQAMQPQVLLRTSVRAEWSEAQVPCQRGQRWQWDGVSFEILHPAPEDDARAARPNALSCVLRIEDAHGRRALLVGDIEAAQEARLVRREPDLRADWLLVPHHGSKTSSTQAFLEAVHPRWAVVQSGYRNRFGHPHPQVVARYEALGMDLRNTAHCGAITWRSARPDELTCLRQAQPRYWQ